MRSEAVTLKGTEALFDVTADGRPHIPLDPRAVFAFGHLIRSTEKLLLDLFSSGELSGTTHTCLGQELCQMSVVRVLDHPKDVVFSNHRNHGHFLTYSGDFVGLIAELMGREAGICRGRGGSQHIAFRGFHSSGVQGGMTAIAVGQALAHKRNSDAGIITVIVGDGTLGQGIVYEALNLAAVWDVPLLFVVENNGIAQTTATAATTAGSLTARAEAFGLQTWRINDSEPDFLQNAAAIVAKTRRSRSPGFLVIDTMRHGPHSKGDDSRTEAELTAIHAHDPLARLGETLPTTTREGIEDQVRCFLAEALELARASPPARFESVPRNVFPATVAPRLKRTAPSPQPSRTVRKALTTALDRLLGADERTILLGEDLHDPYGGAFKVTEGLSTKYQGRVLSTPISEAGIIGAGIGLAMTGLRPIVEIMFADFLSLGFDQIYNHAVKFPGMFDGVDIPLVIRTACGGGRGYGATHSQSPESLCAAVPGLTVVCCSHRHNLVQLLEAAVMDWLHPLVFFEHKLLYALPNDPGDYEALEFVQEDPGAPLFPVLTNGRSNPDVTIVTFGWMTTVAEAAAERLEQEEELAVEIVVLSLISPLPHRTLARALAGRPRVVTLEEGPVEFGVGTEIAAGLAESGFDGEVLRIGAPPVPIPSARSLEEQILPNENTLVAAIYDLFRDER